MNRGVKLGLGALGFLGANGATIPFIHQSLSSSNTSVGQFGGGISYRTGLDKRGSGDFKLGLGKDKPEGLELSLDSSGPSSSGVKLDLQRSDTSDLSLDPLSSLGKDSASLTESIGKIHKEIDREARVKEIEQELERQYSSLSSEQLKDSENKKKEHLKNYGDAKSLVNRKGSSRRLTKEQREAIGKYFLLNCYLRIEARKLSEQLREQLTNGLRDLIPSEPISSQQISDPECNEIKKELGEIEWEGEQIKTQNNWEDWTKNPFRRFFDTPQDFVSAVNKQKQLASKAEQAEMLHKRTRTNWRGRFPDQYNRATAVIEESKRSAGAHIERRVAQKLLKLMKQLD